MAIPTMSNSKLNLYNNPQDLATTTKKKDGSEPQRVPNGTNNANIVGGQAGMYAQVAQMAYNSVFGAITKRKTANLQAAQIEGNSELEYQANKFNVQQMKQQEREIAESSLFSFLETIEYGKNFAATQKAISSAQGSWYGSTFDAFLEDTAFKIGQEISERGKESAQARANIRLQADMLNIKNEIEHKIAKANAKGIRSAGKTNSLLSIFGLG